MTSFGAQSDMHIDDNLRRDKQASTGACVHRPWPNAPTSNDYHAPTQFTTPPTQFTTPPTQLHSGSHLRQRVHPIQPSWVAGAVRHQERCREGGRAEARALRRPPQVPLDLLLQQLHAPLGERAGPENCQGACGNNGLGGKGNGNDSGPAPGVGGPCKLCEPRTPRAPGRA